VADFHIPGACPTPSKSSFDLRRTSCQKPAPPSIAVPVDKTFISFSLRALPEIPAVFTLFFSHLTIIIVLFRVYFGKSNVYMAGYDKL